LSSRSACLLEDPPLRRRPRRACPLILQAAASLAAPNPALSTSLSKYAYLSHADLLTDPLTFPLPARLSSLLCSARPFFLVGRSFPSLFSVSVATFVLESFVKSLQGFVTDLQVSETLPFNLPLHLFMLVPESFSVDEDYCPCVGLPLLIAFPFIVIPFILSCPYLPSLPLTMGAFHACGGPSGAGLIYFFSRPVVSSIEYVIIEPVPYDPPSASCLKLDYALPRASLGRRSLRIAQPYCSPRRGHSCHWVSQFFYALLFIPVLLLSHTRLLMFEIAAALA